MTLATITLTKRSRLSGWKCTDLEVIISGFNEKWCPYSGNLILTRRPNLQQKLTIFILLALGTITKNEGYQQYVENWLETMNKKVETLIEKHRNDPFGIVEEILWIKKV